MTGGNSGIGKALALAEAGASIAIANRDEESGKVAATKIDEETDTETVAVTVDVTGGTQVKAMVETVREEFSTVGALTNNAGMTINTLDCLTSP